jgi:hypothetical protein
MENGSLFELVEELTIQLCCRYLEAGSIVMLFSATHFVSGTAGYAEELVAAIRNLKRLIGKHVTYTPLPHFFLDGCADEATIRVAVEVAAWANIFFGRERLLLRRTFVAANEILIESGTGGAQLLASYKIRLPNGDKGGTATWAAGNVSGLPAVVRPAGMSQEKHLYSAMA